MVRDLGDKRFPAFMITVVFGSCSPCTCWTLHRRDAGDRPGPGGRLTERRQRWSSTCRSSAAGPRRPLLPRQRAGVAPRRAEGADGGEVGALRVRHRAPPRSARPLPGALLPRGDDLHHLRHRDHLPLPLRRARTRSSARSASARWCCSPSPCSPRSSTSSPTAPSTGARPSGSRPVVDEGMVSATRTATHDGPAGRARGPGRRAASRSRRPDVPKILGIDPDVGLDGADHNFLTGTLEGLVKWARQKSIFPATFGLACCAIEMMATGGPALRPRPLRHGGLPGLAPPGRPHDRRRPGQPEDGAGAAPDLRPDGRAEVGHLDGRVRVDAAACSTTTPSSRASTRSCRSTCTPRAARPGPETLQHAILTLHKVIASGELTRRREATGAGAEHPRRAARRADAA